MYPWETWIVALVKETGNSQTPPLPPSSKELKEHQYLGLRSDPISGGGGSLAHPA